MIKETFMRKDHGTTIEVQKIFSSNNKRLMDMKDNKKSLLYEILHLVKNYALINHEVFFRLTCTDKNKKIIENFQKTS